MFKNLYWAARRKGLLSRRRMVSQLNYAPFLRILLTSFWFRYVFLCFLLTGLVLALALPKIWRATPEGFLPEVRTSIVDRLQAWSLRRTAEKLAGAGKYEPAVKAWESAIGNAPGKPDLTRGFLRSASEIGTSKIAPRVFRHADWLLRLTRTNLADVALVTKAYTACGLQAAVPSLLEPLNERLTPELEVAYLRSLFESGSLGQFAARWERVQARLPADAELALYREAFLAGWGPAKDADSAQAKLAQAAVSGEHLALANRLVLQTASRRGDLVSCEQAITKLVEMKADRLLDHLAYWNLLQRQNQPEKARLLIDSFAELPRTPQEVVGFAELCVRAGLRPRARLLLERAAREMLGSAPVATAYANLLIEDQDWGALRALAVGLQAQPGLPMAWLAFCQYLSGLAELGEGHTEESKKTFASLGKLKCDDPILGLFVARGLLDLNQIGLAGTFLQQLEARLRSKVEFWMLVARAADAEKDTAYLLQATENAYRLAPDQALLANNYAGTLLLERSKPEEALRILAAQLEKNPQDPVLQANYAEALNQNRRPAEARELLLKTDPNALPAAARTQFFLTFFEVCVTLGRFQEAWSCRPLINPQDLYPAQQKRLAAIVETLPPESIAIPPD